MSCGRGERPAPGRFEILGHGEDAERLRRRTLCALGGLGYYTSIRIRADLEGAISLGARKGPVLVLDGRLFQDGLVSAECLLERLQRRFSATTWMGEAPQGCQEDCRATIDRGIFPTIRRQKMNELQEAMQATIDDMVQEGRGVLAADESLPTMAKRLQAIGVENTEENRRAWRSLLVTTEGLGEYISGIILFEETLGQRTEDGRTIPEAAWDQRIVPGIKVDKGKIPLALSPGDLITQGLDGLADRLETYKKQGARFAKWREVYKIDHHAPTVHGIEANAEMLARYAAVCQSVGVVPIVEPEVLMDGDHDIDRHGEVTEAVQHAVFHALHRHHVTLELMILKPNMVLPGTERPKASPDEVAEATLKVLRRTVPAAVPSINFLSGGQGAEEATINLNALNQRRDRAPWRLSISYGRALQQPALHAWMGKAENRAAAQQALLKRARLNHLAMLGQYDPAMEKD